jgi:hypothetical protein
MRVRMISATRPSTVAKAERAISRRHQPLGKADAFGLVAVQQAVWRAAGQHGRQFPGQIDGVADAGVHALSADRAMDMRGVAEQERAIFAEVLRHPMMHVIGREPIHLLDLNLEVVDSLAADVPELERIGMIGALVPDGSDQTRPAFAGQREDGKEVGFVKVDVQFAIDGGTGRLDIGDVEHMAIGSAGKTSAEGLTHQ